MIENGIIQDYGEMFKAGSFEGYEIIGAKGAYVGPGLVDIHVHAGDDREFYVDPIHAAKFMLQQGATTILPTLSFGLDHESLINAIDIVRQAKDLPGGESISGIYMEGPYLNPKYGTGRDRISFKGAAKREEYQEIISRCGNDVRVWAVAPERENIEQFMRDAKTANPNVVFAVAHSEATPQQVEELEERLSEVCELT
ncbi:MAG: amidohydrolase family protein [Oscillospiraceae bacterium]|nr:amidohydrolase family protein [Oscillospiraceae bacterium]